MRQAILVVVLISASFLGGAFVNGPALNWAQSRVMRSLGLHESAEIASVSLRATSAAEASSGGSQPTTDSPTLQEPIAPAPTVINQQPTSPGQETSGRAQAKPKRRDETAQEFTQVISQTSQSPKPSSGNLGREPVSSSTRDMALSTAMLESGKLSAPDSASMQPGPGITGYKVEPMGKQALNPSISDSPDWTGLQRKMKTLGITRFTIEGEPGSRIVFSCLIPLAGNQAVSQRFEADGEDILAAAKSALRRVALLASDAIPSSIITGTVGVDAHPLIFPILTGF